MSRYRICNSFNGYIEEIPEIFVDNFETLGKKAYFLSHCHEDHIQGLFTKQFLEYLEESATFIYMSEISATIIDLRGGGEYTKYLKPLKLGSSLITIRNESKENSSDLYLNVSLIPAGHCFGSVMFLFRKTNQTVLYTGDFRINPNDISKYNQLHRNMEPIVIDVMYVDTTFQGIDFEDFPKRSETVEYAIDEIRSWLEKDEDRCVGLHTSAKLGYEFVFKEVYKQLNMKVYVSEEVWELYSKFLELRDVVTREKTTKIHLCRDRFENGNHKHCDILLQNKKCLFVHFSAFLWKKCDVSAKSVVKNDNRINVCFSTHCSRSELRAFVNYFAPKKVVGFREPYVECEESKCDFKSEFVWSPPKKVVCTRQGVRKVPVDMLKKMFED